MYAAPIRAADSVAYHGSTHGDSEIAGPAMTLGAWKASRAPA